MSTVDFTLEPIDYVTYDDSGNCVPGVAEHNHDRGWAFGIIFLRKFLMIYDIGNERLGFVRAK
jgi:hypothetical protein